MNSEKKIQDFCLIAELSITDYFHRLVISGGDQTYSSINYKYNLLQKIYNKKSLGEKELLTL